jgi:hypothetical protein
VSVSGSTLSGDSAGSSGSGQGGALFVESQTSGSRGGVGG